jgi:hypothetical protein
LKGPPLSQAEGPLSLQEVPANQLVSWSATVSQRTDRGSASWFHGHDGDFRQEKIMFENIFKIQINIDLDNIY